ncbi:hypothetical protein [Thermosipho sp. 1070]|uniref:hypothetical protein n=1 Tax=Thermosipho sp. 1070 TaxID=1437364 RepID=UPI0012FB6725|nr:hypothetical protein [Thermosipho sp. 1070]
MRMENNLLFKPSIWFVEKCLNFKGTSIFAVILSLFDMYLIIEKANLPTASPDGNAPLWIKIVWTIMLIYLATGIEVIFKNEKMNRSRGAGWIFAIFIEYICITTVIWSVILYIFYGNRDVLNKGLKWIIIYLLILVLVHPLNKKNIIFVMMKNKKRRYF